MMVVTKGTYLILVTSKTDIFEVVDIDTADSVDLYDIVNIRTQYKSTYIIEKIEAGFSGYWLQKNDISVQGSKVLSIYYSDGEYKVKLYNKGYANMSMATAVKVFELT